MQLQEIVIRHCVDNKRTFAGELCTEWASLAPPFRAAMKCEICFPLKCHQNA